MKFTKKSNPTNNKKAASKENRTLRRPKNDSSSNVTKTVLSRNGSRSLNKNAPVIIEQDSMLAEMNVELYDINNVEEFGSSNKPNKNNIFRLL